MTTKPSTLYDRESLVHDQLRPSLIDYVDLAAREHNLFVRCANEIAGEDLSIAGSVMLVATARVLGDLRVCQWSASHGYALQAQTVASTVHELAYSAAYIGDSEERADAWMKHENERRAYPESGHSAVIAAVLQRLGQPKSLSDQEYMIYTQLCMAKHGNAVVQRLHGTTTEEGQTVIEQLPYFDQTTLVLSRFGLFHAIRAVSALLTVLLTTHLLISLNRETTMEFSEIASRIRELAIRDELVEMDSNGNAMAIEPKP